MEPKPIVLPRDRDAELYQLEKKANFQKKYLLTPDTHFVEELGDRYIIDLGAHFSLWSGFYSPFFQIDTVKTPEYPEGFKVAK